MHCVVCATRGKAKAADEDGGPEIATANDYKLLCSELPRRELGGGQPLSDNSSRETRNDENHHGEQRRMAESVIVVTEDGVELSPGICSVDSRRSTDVEYVSSDDDEFNDGASVIKASSRGDDHEGFNSKEKRQPNEQTNNALFMAALDKLARLQRQQGTKSVKLHDIMEEEYQSNSSCDAFASDSASAPPSCGNHEIVNAPLIDTGVEKMTVSELNEEIIDDIDSTLASYNSGKAFASQVIQNTNHILNDLGVDSKGVSECVSNSSHGVCVSQLSGNENKSIYFDKLVTKCVLNDWEYKMPQTTSVAPERINSPTSPIARKRITINNLAHGFASTTVASPTRTKQKNTVPKSENKRVDGYSVDRVASSGFSTELKSDIRNDESPETLESVAVPGRGTTDDFFSELRHHALVAKATSFQKKLEADGYNTRRNKSFTTEVMKSIDTEVKHEEVNDLEFPPVHSPDTATMIQVESSIPDDEKKYIALKSVREEKVVQPFDESVQQQGSSEPQSLPPTSTFSPVAPDAPNEIDTETMISHASRSAKLQTDNQHPSVESVSVKSLSPTVQLQTSRIAQLEADALHKHQVAEQAAASAREVLEQMIKARKERQDKVEARNKKNDRAKDMTQDTTPKVVSESKLIHDNADQLSLCSTLSSDQKAEYKYSKVDSSGKIEIRRRGGEDTTFASYDHTTDYSTASASQYGVEKHTYYPKTPKDVSSMVSRDSKSSVAGSESSTSTYSSVDDTDRWHHRRHDRTRHNRSSSATRSRTLDSKTNLFLPSLCTPDSISSRISQQHPLRSHYRSQSASPRHRLRDMRSIPTATPQSMKPNHLVSYSPRGDAKEARKMIMGPLSSKREARLRTSMRPEPLSSVHFNSEHHTPMSHRFSEGGLSKEQYAPSSRMASFTLNAETNAAAGLQYHAYGGRSLTPKSVPEQNRYGFRSYAQIPSGYRHPTTTRSIDALLLAKNQDSMPSMNHEIMRQRRTGFASPAAQEPLIMSNYPYSYSNNATVLPQNPYGGRSITPKSFHEQKRYGFRSFEQQPFHPQGAPPRSFDAVPLAYHQSHPEWMNSMNQVFMSRQQPMMPRVAAGHYGTPSVMHPFNSPAKVSFFDNYEEDMDEQPQFLSQPFQQQQQQQQQQFPFVLH